MKKCLTLMALVGLLNGCSDQVKSELNLAIPEGVSAETKALVTAGWSKVKAACPGLNEYASSLQLKTIEDNFAYASSKDAERASIVFNVNESRSIVIGNQVVSGQTCSFEISRNGSTLSVPKRSCASLCEGKEVTDSEYKKAI